MSTGALSHYAAQAELLGVGLPVELRGDAIPLLGTDDPRVISVHALDSDRAVEVGQRFGQVVETAKQFVLAASVDTPDGRSLITPTTIRRDTRMAAVARHLVPRTVRTGQLVTVSAEAIAPDEVPEEALQGFPEGARKELEAALGDAASGAVCLLTYGDLKVGNSRGITRALTVVAAMPYRRGGSQLKDGRTITYYGAPFADNRHFGERAIAGSALAAYAAEATMRSIPVQQTAVRRPRFVGGTETFSRK